MKPTITEPSTEEYSTAQVDRHDTVVTLQTLDKKIFEAT